ncbi:MAG: GGDEF domain-containing response regulator [Polyangia bacterium]
MAGILIVEPPSPARDELERALGIAGHRVLVVGDGQSALETWRTERQELAILDEAATHVNGLGVALRMKAESPSSFMPVMIVTARDAVARAAALAVADDVLTRPFDVREVVARVTALLRTRSIVDELRLQRAESEAKTYADATTGLRNRAFLGERIGEEFKRAVRYNEPLSLVLLCVEGMREVIDKRGAGTADRLLQSVANASLRSLRQIDVVTRYSAHELAALLPNTHLAGALTCADRLRRETATAAVDDTKAVVSMGIAFYPGKDVNDATDLLRMAARALERAREEGAGSICLYQHQGYLFQPK